MADSDCEELSVIGDKGEIRFIDYEVDQSVASYNPNEEGPVTVSVPFPFVEGKPPSVPVNEVAAASFTIQNMTDEYVIINGVNIHASNPEDSFILSLMKPPSGQPDDISKEDFVGSFSMEDRSLKPHDVLTVWLSCLPKELGIFTTIVHIDFGGDTFQDDRIERVVFLLAEDKVSKDMVSGKPYQRGWRKKTAFAMDSYVTGVRPSRPMKRHFKNRLPEYKIPKDVRELIENKEIPEVVLQGLTRINYASYFRTLLIMEELRIEEDMKAYYMECVTLRRKGRYFLGLMVPGLAERRPSLVHGDAVYVKLANDDNGKAYEGCIHRVEADEVLLQFADMFHRLHNEDNLYNVRFAYNRVNFRRLYQAIESAEVLHRRFLFPTEYDGKRRITAKNLQPISHFLNTEQANAVRLILGCRGGAPYVIHGPPGTGKTKTLVEVILQLCKTRQNCRILVCASSNCAADHILEKMLSEGMQVNENEIFRLNATSRPFEDINPDYWKFCCYEEDQIFLCPSLDSLRSYRIIITTYMSASSLYAGGVKNNHFSHIILDEAGQASEPETMIPISNLCDKNTVIVLAGDPMQLGPVVHSKDAEAFGLGRSYLERLFESELYRSEDPNYVTMLVKNYRSHPEILSLSSRLFYKGALIPSREENEASLRWADLLPNSEFPVVFFGIQGMDEREGSNPSWFNRIEASKVVELIKKLISREVPEHDIGVITPYRQQVAKIKNVLESLNMPDIKIGSVEQFQGQEREVIIVSTVRSTVKHNEFDKTFCLGFLSNPKRFNVAMTRARSLLIIVGNPHIISKDWYWEQMLWHCTDNNSYQGCALPVKEQDPYNGVGNWSSGGEEESKVGNPTNNWDQTAVSWGSGGEEESKVDEDTSKAVKDEDEWSDGWK